MKRAISLDAVLAMIVVTACSYWEDTTPDILASFYGEKP